MENLTMEETEKALAILHEARKLLSMSRTEPQRNSPRGSTG
ncbi:hypothetical protein [Desulfuromonas sp.]|nr:hypothetical protein [Desulfuromonas sp.]